MTSLAALNGCLQSKDPFSFIFNSKTNELHYQKLRSRQKTNWSESANSFMLFLQYLPTPNSPRDALESKLLLATKDVIKIISKKVEKDSKLNSTLEKCNHLLLAHRLAIPENVLIANDGFASFAKKCFLYNYLATYGESLSYIPETRELLIKYKKQHVKWSLVPEAIKQFPAEKDDVPYEAWKYGPNGLRNKNFYDFVKLKKVFRRDPRAWGNRFLIGLCTTCVEKPRTTAGDHSWIRLYDADTGKVYSVGLYRPNKKYEDYPKKDCLRLKPGYLMIDSSEFWGQPIQEIRAMITKQDFLEMIALVEKDKTKEITRRSSDDRIEDALTFQLMQGNCTAYAGRVANVAKVSLPDNIPFYTAWIYSICYSAKWIGRIAALQRWIPHWIIRINTVMTTVLGNLVGLAFGAWKVDRKLALAANASPAFANWRHLFDRNLILNRSPFVLGQITRVKIEQWREQGTIKLRTKLNGATEDERAVLMRQIDDLQFQLPPEGYLK